MDLAGVSMEPVVQLYCLEVACLKVAGLGVARLGD